MVLFVCFFSTEVCTQGLMCASLLLLEPLHPPPGICFIYHFKPIQFYLIQLKNIVSQKQSLVVLHQELQQIKRQWCQRIIQRKPVENTGSSWTPSYSGHLSPGELFDMQNFFLGMTLIKRATQSQFWIGQLLFVETWNGEVMIWMESQDWVTLMLVLEKE